MPDENELFDKIKASDPCMSAAMDEIMKAHPDMPHKQVVAEAMSKCGDSAADGNDSEPDSDPDDKKALGEKRDISTETRNEADDSDFVDPKNRSFPILKAADVNAAVHSWGRYKGDMSFEQFKARLIRIAKRKGFTSSLPSEWGVKSFEDRLRDGLKALGILKDEDDPISGFKVFDNHYLCVWSNNFKDRDGEIFTEKAIDDYIARVDMGVVPLPELWVWHIPGTRIGQAEFVARHGHFVVSVGTFDDTSDGRAAQAYYSKHAGEKGISHGYQYPRNRYDGKHYHSFNTFENSPLPLGAEANLYTSLEGVKETKVDERKQQELEKVFGKERAAQILANLDERGKALESLGVEFKDFVDPNPDPANANKEAVELANKSLVDLFPDLIEGQSETISAVMTLTKQVKQVLTDNAELRKELDAAKADVTAIRDGAPRASQSSKTVVKENDPLAKKSQLGLTPEQEKLAETMPGLFKQG